MSEHDPGDLYEGPPPHRRRRREYRHESEVDDAWALADEEGAYDDHIDVGDMAAAGQWEDRERLGVGPDDEDDDTLQYDPSPLGPLPESARRLRERRSLPPREQRLRQRFDRSQAYANSPSFRKNQQGRVGRIISRLSGDDDLYAPAKRKRDDVRTSAPLANIPAWGIVVLVTLAVMAVLAAILALVSIVVLLG